MLAPALLLAALTAGADAPAATAMRQLVTAGVTGRELLAERWWEAGKESRDAGNPSAALPLFNACIHLHPQHDSARISRAKVLAKLGRRDEESDDYEEHVRRHPFDADAWSHIGEAWLARGRIEHLATCFEHAMARMPGEADRYRLLRAGVLAGATWELKPKAMPKLNLLSETVAGLPPGRVEVARAELTALVDSGRFEAEARMLRGIVLFGTGDLAGGEADLRRVAAEQPENADLAFNLGTCARARNDPAAAADQFDRALRLQPNRPAFLTARAEVNLELNRYEKAAADFEVLRRQGGLGDNAVKTLALLYCILGRDGDAEALLAAVAGPQRDGYRALVLRQFVFLFAEGHREAALRSYDRAWDDPRFDRGELRYHRGYVRHRLGETAAGIDDLTAAVRLSPDHPDCRRSRVDMSRRQGKFGQAVEDAEVLVRLEFWEPKNHRLLAAVREEWRTDTAMLRDLGGRCDPPGPWAPVCRPRFEFAVGRGFIGCWRASGPLRLAISSD